jgi:hypothetical protein
VAAVLAVAAAADVDAGGRAAAAFVLSCCFGTEVEGAREVVAVDAAAAAGAAGGVESFLAVAIAWRTGLADRSVDNAVVVVVHAEVDELAPGKTPFRYFWKKKFV